MKMKDLIRVFFYPFIKFYFLFKPLKINIRSLDSTLDRLLYNDASIIRFGDGELKLINGKSICYQDYDEHLARELQTIINVNDSKLLIAFPDVFNPKKLTLSAKLFWNFDLFLKQNLYREFNKKTFDNTFISRPYMDYKNKKDKILFFRKLQHLWEKKSIIFIEGATTRNGLNNDLYSNAKSIERIICPSSNAYSKKKQIVEYVKLNIPKEKLICISLGPCAKVIAYELYRLGYRVLDIGHLDSEYEWCLCNAKRKIKINGKHTAEYDDDNLIICKDENYLAQIIVSFE